ncbi:MAG: DegT/DnrJ/EryC1/StrS aminotransferase family protein, partial [Phycisphaerales bacterium]|nr:DegT/DnrJ/EryC1/StrS aminotransferase family protein [Phycisphaerales bacterium]
MSNSQVIPLSRPDISQGDIRAVTDVLRSGRLSLGPAMDTFEDMMAERVGSSDAVAVSSGTAGLHLILEALNVGPGDEVITPAFSFVASANCIEHAGATPVFVDCDPITLNVKAEDVEALITERTKAIIGVEVFGNPTGMRELAALSAKHEIPLIEDACEGLGGRIGDDAIGT